MNKILRYSFVALMAMVFGNASAEDQDVVFTFNTDDGLTELGIAKPEAGNGTNLADLSTANTLTKGVITITNATGENKTETRVWNSNGNLDLRIYATSSLTFTTSEKVIKKIVLAGNTVGGFTASEGSFNAGTWEGAAASVALTATGTEKINTITITYGDKPSVTAPTIAGEAKFEETASITITAEEGSKIYYTDNGDNPTTSSTVYTAAISINKTTTIKAIAEKDGTISTVAAATFTRILPANGGTTAQTALSVADALEFIGTLGSETSNEIYIKGKVSTAPSKAPSSQGKLTFYISDDGTTTNQLQSYSTLGIDKAQFTAQDDIKANDEVVIIGKVKMYNNTTPEIDNGYLYSLNGVTTGINTVKAVQQNGAIYNVAGQMVTSSYKGLVIKNGKKFIQK